MDITSGLQLSGMQKKKRQTHVTWQTYCSTYIRAFLSKLGIADHCTRDCILKGIKKRNYITVNYKAIKSDNVKNKVIKRPLVYQNNTNTIFETFKFNDFDRQNKSFHPHISLPHSYLNYLVTSQCTKQPPVHSYTVDFNLTKSADDIFYNYQISGPLLISAPGSQRVNLESLCGDLSDTCTARNNYSHI